MPITPVSRMIGGSTSCRVIRMFSHVVSSFTTALGKKPQPRMTYTTTNGDVCDGVLDDLIEKSKRIA